MEMYKLLTKVKLQQWMASFSVGKAGKKSVKRGAAFMTVILVYSAAALGFLFYTLCDQLAEAGFPQLYLCLAGLMTFGVSMITSMFSVAYQVFSGKNGIGL